MAVLAAAFASFAAATASATTLNGSGGTALGLGTTISAESEGTVILDAAIGKLECKKSQISGKISRAGGAAETVEVAVETYSDTECNSVFAVLKKGTLEIHTQSEGANSNGTVTWNGTELTTELGGFHCIWATTTSADVGTLTGSTTTGGSAKLDVSVELPRTGGRSGALCGTKTQFTAAYKFTAPSTLNVDSTVVEKPELSGEVSTGYVGETLTVTWKNTGNKSATISDETNSDSTVVETTGTACTTIAIGGSCTNRKVKCLKEGKATLTIRDTTVTPEAKAEVTVNCDKTLTGEPTSGTVGSTVTVTWKNDSRSAVTIEDESTSNSEIAKTVGTGCETIAAGGSCTSRKIECLKAGEATIIATDTPLVEGKFTINCTNPVIFTGEAPTGHVGETVTITWKNTGTGSGTVNDETNSDSTVAETTGTACTTIAGGGSCTSRKVQCLKVGESTLTIRDTTASAEGKVTIKCDAYALTGEAPTGVVTETGTVTWKNSGGISVTFDDETVSDPTVVETTGTACGTVAASGSCTSRKVKCLKKGEATITVKDTPLIESKVTVKCDDILEGGPTTGKVGETVTVTWTNNSMSAVTIEDEATSVGTVAETLGSSCGEIVATGTCTKRKIKCLKAGESTITAVDTPSIEGKFVIKCS